MVLCSDSAAGLQKLIDGLYEFCRKWHLIVSLTKTNVMTFSKTAVTDNFKFGDDEVKITNEYNYLGVVFFSRGMLFKKNTGNLVNKARNAEFALNSLVKTTVGHLQPMLALKMFDVQISPITEHGSEVWFSDRETIELEKVHLRHMKNILRVKMSTSTLPLYSELGRFPIILKMKMRLVNFWKRIMSSENNLVRQAYSSLFELSQSSHNGWCDSVISILTEADLLNCWVDQMIDEKSILKLKEAIHKNYMVNCMNDIRDSEKNPKLRTYKLFKREFRLEEYLTSHNNINHVLSLAKFRISSHNLAIETGRYTRPKTPECDRLCIHCDQNETETEQHFLLKCPRYINERNILFQTVRKILPNIDSESLHNKFSKIMSCRDTVLSKALGKYIFDSLVKRNVV